MKARNITLTVLGLALTISAAAYAQENTLYWVSQNNDSKWSYDAFSPDGDYANALTAEPDWSLHDIVFDARYTSGAEVWEGSFGVNNLWGLPPELVVKSVTVAGNWDGSYGNNKSKLWFGGSDNDETHSWTVSGDFNIHSGIGGGFAAKLNVGGTLNIGFADGFAGAKDVSFNYFREINAKNFTIANAGNVILNTARSTRIENNLSVSNSAKFDFSQDALEDSDKAGLHVGGNFTASNLEELRGWKANGLYVGGNFEMSGLKKIDMPSMGVNKAFDGYTASSENGINVAGNMTLAGVGDAASGGSAMFQEAAFLHVGKSLSLVDMKNNASFYNIGSYNGSASGGIEVGDNIIADNSNSDKTRVNFGGSNYLKVGGNIEAVNAGVSFDNIKSVDVKGDVTVTSRGEMTFIGAEKVNIEGSLTANGDWLGIYNLRESLVVGGDMNLKSGAFNNSQSGYTYVGGDLNISGVDAAFGNFKGRDGGAASAGNVGLEVAGKIKLDNGSMAMQYAPGQMGGAATAAGTHFFASAGGIDGTGVLYGMDLDDSGLAHSSTIILNTAENSSFFGHMIWFNSAAWDSTQIHIVKNGAASQKFVINAVDNKWNGSVTVNEGIFEMFLMPGSFTKVDVILNGGSLSVAYSTTGAYNPETDSMGVMSVGRLEINGDTRIVFDAADNRDLGLGYESDVIEADEVGGSGLVTLVIELDATTFSVGDELSGDEAEFNIFRIANSNNYDWAQALIKVMYKGEDISDSFEKLVRFSGDSSGGVYVTLDGVVVPEPAAVASVLGVFALAFAAWRKRK